MQQEDAVKRGESSGPDGQTSKLESRTLSPFSPTPRRRRPSHRYRGHRAHSFTPDDVNELVEIRARQRTFSGAYTRTALGNLGYAITVLRLFDERFYHIGLIYTILAALLFLISYFRSRHSKHDFSDRYLQAISTSSNSNNNNNNDNNNDVTHTHDYTYNNKPYKVPIIKTVGQSGPGKRIFGRPFVTAGWIALAVSFVVLAVEVTLFVLIVRMDV